MCLLIIFSEEAITNKFCFDEMLFFAVKYPNSVHICVRNFYIFAKPDKFCCLAAFLQTVGKTICYSKRKLKKGMFCLTKAPLCGKMIIYYVTAVYR